MIREIGEKMVKFISLKAAVLFGVGLLCLGGSVLLGSMGEGQRPDPTSGIRRVDELEARVRDLNDRILGIESRLGEGCCVKEGEVETLKEQVRALRSLLDDYSNRLDRHEKSVDNRLEKTDNKNNEVKQAPVKRSPVSFPTIYHIVKNGETLYRISKMYNVSEQDLIRLNGLKDKTRIYIGQKLRIKP